MKNTLLLMLLKSLLILSVITASLHAVGQKSKNQIIIPETDIALMMPGKKFTSGSTKKGRIWTYSDKGFNIEIESETKIGIDDNSVIERAVSSGGIADAMGYFVEEIYVPSKISEVTDFSVALKVILDKDVEAIKIFGRKYDEFITITISSITQLSEDGVRKIEAFKDSFKEISETEVSSKKDNSNTGKIAANMVTIPTSNISFKMPEGGTFQFLPNPSTENHYWRADYPNLIIVVDAQKWLYLTTEDVKDLAERSRKIIKNENGKIVKTKLPSQLKKVVDYGEVVMGEYESKTRMTIHAKVKEQYILINITDTSEPIGAKNKDLDYFFASFKRKK